MLDFDRLSSAMVLAGSEVGFGTGSADWVLEFGVEFGLVRWTAKSLNSGNTFISSNGPSTLLANLYFNGSSKIPSLKLLRIALAVPFTTCCLPWSSI